jgi:phage FluMu gp28-like protein
MVDSALVALFNEMFRRTGRHELYPYQADLLGLKSQFTLINKSRQIGISSFEGSYALFRAILHNHKVLVVSPSERQSIHFKAYVDEFWRAWQYWPEMIQPTVKDDNKHELTFREGGGVWAFPNSASTIRGYPADLIITDEFAHFLNRTDADVMEAITPSISRGGQFIGISTPFGEANLFHDIWVNPRTDSKFDKVLIPYTACPDLDVQAIRASGAYDELSFRQEFQNEFIGEANSEFPLQLIMSCVNPELSYLDVEQLKGKACVGGYDVARDRDLSAVHIYEIQGEKAVLRCKYVWAGVPYLEQLDRLNYILAQPNMLRFNIDNTANKEIDEALREKFGFVWGYHMTNELKASMVGSLKTRYEKKNLEMPDDPVLVRAINSIQRKYSETNYLKFDSTRQAEIGHADEFWAQALALYDGGESDLGVAFVHDAAPARRVGGWWGR